MTKGNVEYGFRIVVETPNTIIKSVWSKTRDPNDVEAYNELKSTVESVVSGKMTILIFNCEYPITHTDIRLKKVYINKSILESSILYVEQSEKQL
jgi:hypothetical protein